VNSYLMMGKRMDG